MRKSGNKRRARNYHLALSSVPTSNSRHLPFSFDRYPEGVTYGVLARPPRWIDLDYEPCKPLPA